VPGSDVVYAVEQLRDGRRFSSRRVRALAGERLLSESTVSFASDTDGLSYQAAAPAVPAPDGLPVFDPSGEPPSSEAPRRPPFLFEQRLIRWSGPQAGGRNALEVWARPAGAVPNDPLLRAAVLAALSDISTQLLGLDPRVVPRPSAASLNHMLWLHELPPLDGWLLVLRESTIAAHGRVLQSGAIYTRAGIRCASLAQESLIAHE
jgi:acyl-CoA thioesterase-2